MTPSSADLANKNSADAGSALDGGLYQKLHKGQLTPVLDDWCFDDARQSGDVDILRSGLGYHIVFFKGAPTSGTTLPGKT